MDWTAVTRPLKKLMNYSRRLGYTFCYPWCCLTKVSSFHSFGFSFREHSQGNAYVKLGFESFKIPSRHNISIIRLHFCQLLTLGIKILSCFPERWKKRQEKRKSQREGFSFSLFIEASFTRHRTNFDRLKIRAFRCSVHTERSNSTKI